MRIIVDYGRSLTSPRRVLSRHGNDFAWDRAARRENVSDLETDAEFRRGIARDVAMPKLRPFKPLMVAPGLFLGCYGLGFRAVEAPGSLTQFSRDLVEIEKGIVLGLLCLQCRSLLSTLEEGRPQPLNPSKPKQPELLNF